MGVHERCRAESRKEDHEHDVANAHHKGDHLGVDADEPLNEALNRVENQAHDAGMLLLSAQQDGGKRG
jgi:hypothetical protein